MSKWEHSHFLFQYKTTRDEFPQSVEYFHTHQQIEILYVYEGSGHVILDDRFYAVSPRTLLLFKPFQLHYIHMDIPPKYSSTLFKVSPAFMDRCALYFPRCFDMVSDFLNRSDRRQIFRLNGSQHDQLEERFRSLDGVLRASPRNLHEEAVILFALHFFIDFMTQMAPTADAGKPIKPLRKSQRVNEVLKWVDAHYKERFTLEKLADDLHFSATYISKLFRQQIGKSISEYVTEKRLEQARILLQTESLSVEEIGEETGFNSPSYFIRMFKQKFGVPPHQYRLNAAQMYASTE
ncbi:helix-turn-helix transcriptional regulator [Paenibacillus oceani]|uniref:Helix-turn-helix transcriptional regulator n=1 Tax=Paenibacillus oceani TaxID=2772510 RepID=A0A927H264_9BACL|nr:AraC family transcriptional regulator [Paenibacillus oceani]MBD2865490.1 helix-turn-helix transcriptional regulator [Paenibacillus oceani]